MNKFALITGASRGIGLAVAKYFAQKGFDLALIAKDEKRLKEAKELLQNLNPNIKASTYSIDLADIQNTYLTIKSIFTQQGYVDIVFNNAGVAKKGSVDAPLEDFIEMNLVNVQGAFAVMKAAGEFMKAQKSGYIMNLASHLGKLGLENLSAYCSSKHAVVGMTESLFKELMPYGIKLTTLCPSVIDTDMTKDHAVPNDKKIETADIVKTVDYLLSLSSNAVLSTIDIQCRYIVSESKSL